MLRLKLLPKLARFLSHPCPLARFPHLSTPPPPPHLPRLSHPTSLLARLLASESGDPGGKNGRDGHGGAPPPEDWNYSFDEFLEDIDIKKDETLEEAWKRVVEEHKEAADAEKDNKPEGKQGDEEFLDRFLKKGEGTDKDFMERFFGKGEEEAEGWEGDDSGLKQEEELGQEESSVLSGVDAKGGDEEEEEKASKDNEEKAEDQEQEGIEAEDAEIVSMYAGRIFPHHDDRLRLNKLHRKRLRYKKKYQENAPILKIDGSDAEEEEEKAGQIEGAGSKPEGDEMDEDEVDMDKEIAAARQTFEKLKSEAKYWKKDELVFDPKAAERARKQFNNWLIKKGLKEDDADADEFVREHRMKQNKLKGLPRFVLPSDKEQMWKLHKENPEEWTVEKLAQEYNLRKARVHAILWLWDLRKQAEEKRGEDKKEEEDGASLILHEDREFLGALCYLSDGEDVQLPEVQDRRRTVWATKPNFKIMPDDWEGSARDEEDLIEEVSAKEEAMALEEFERRMEFNKLQIAGAIKTDTYSRRRPPEGWSYMVEALGPQNKRGRGGGYRFIASSNGTRRPLNDMEKMYLRRETIQPRRKLV